MMMHVGTNWFTSDQYKFFLKNPKKYLEEATKAFNKIMRGLEDK